MIPRKLSEIFFGQLWLLVIPVLTVPLVVAILLRPEPTYQSYATVWVGRTVTGASTTFGQSNPYLSPAQNQAQTITDLLSTKSFRLEVATTAGLVSDGETSAGIPLFDVWAGTSGANLVVITAQSSNPTAAAQIVSAVLSSYSERVKEGATRQATSTAGYYEQQLPVAEAELAAREAKVQEYLQAHPEAGIVGSAESFDLDYRTLVNNVQTQQTLVEDIQKNIQATQLALASIDEDQGSSFQVQDPPTVPSVPVAVSKAHKFGMPVVGLMLGLLIAGGYLAVRYRTDHTIRSVEDLDGMGVVVLGGVADLHPNGIWWRLSPDRIFARKKVMSFARRIAASIPQLEER